LAEVFAFGFVLLWLLFLRLGAFFFPMPAACYKLTHCAMPVDFKLHHYRRREQLMYLPKIPVGTACKSYRP